VPDAASITKSASAKCLLSCPFYQSGPTRKVPGRKGMSYTEEDWVDVDATAHRGPED
jgi:hypothetical protein